MGRFDFAAAGSGLGRFKHGTPELDKDGFEFVEGKT
jgi:hypothetical protein